MWLKEKKKYVQKKNNLVIKIQAYSSNISYWSISWLYSFEYLTIPLIRNWNRNDMNRFRIPTTKWNILSMPSPDMGTECWRFYRGFISEHSDFSLPSLHHVENVCLKLAFRGIHNNEQTSKNVCVSLGFYKICPQKLKMGFARP